VISASSVENTVLSVSIADWTGQLSAGVDAERLQAPKTSAQQATAQAT